MNDPIKNITALDALMDARTDLEMALRPYALQVGKPVDPIDYEHLQKSLSTLNLLIRSQNGGPGGQ
jgi:hypothetical protein